jgi:hypothetical protein
MTNINVLWKSIVAHDKVRKCAYNFGKLILASWSVPIAVPLILAPIYGIKPIDDAFMVVLEVLAVCCGVIFGLIWVVFAIIVIFIIFIVILAVARILAAGFGIEPVTVILKAAIKAINVLVACFFPAVIIILSVLFFTIGMVIITMLVPFSVFSSRDDFPIVAIVFVVIFSLINCAVYAVIFSIADVEYMINVLIGFIVSSSISVGMIVLFSSNEKSSLVIAIVVNTLAGIILLYSNKKSITETAGAIVRSYAKDLNRESITTTESVNEEYIAMAEGFEMSNFSQRLNV